MSTIFDAEAYWGQREFKKWVVYLSKHRGYSSQSIASDTKYVRARTRAAACKVARRESLLSGNVSAHARLATPWDLGIV